MNESYPALATLHRVGGRGLPPPTAPAVLRLGMSGPEVKALQLQLNELGESLLASGQYGPRTMEAVRRFQVAKGIKPASGLVDAATRKVLAELRQAGNPRTIPRERRAAEWFESSAQSQPARDEAAPESVMLSLSDGRSLTVEQAVEVMKAAFEKTRGGTPRDPDDPRDLAAETVWRELQKLQAKGWLTASERRQLAHTLKAALPLLGEADVLAIGGAASPPAVRIIE